MTVTVAPEAAVLRLTVKEPLDGVFTLTEYDADFVPLLELPPLELLEPLDELPPPDELPPLEPPDELPPLEPPDELPPLFALFFTVTFTEVRVRSVF